MENVQINLIKRNKNNCITLNNKDLIIVFNRDYNISSSYMVVSYRGTCNKAQGNERNYCSFMNLRDGGIPVMCCNERSTNMRDIKRALGIICNDIEIKIIKKDNYIININEKDVI